MADLYNLDDEILNNELNQEEEENLAVGDAEEGDEWENHSDQEDREEIELPSVLLGASKQNLDEDAEQAEEEEERALDLQDFAAKPSSQQLENLPYTRLYDAWAQECRNPELLPLDRETVLQMREAVAATDDEDNENNAFIETGNANMDALFRRLQHIDVQRVKFLLADLLKRRLQKIEAHPLHMRTLTERMSEAEVDFLKEYGAAVERHFEITVTNHIPQECWRKLDTPEMIDEPDLDKFVFLRCLEDIVVDNDGNGDSQAHAAGACLIVRYRRVRDLCLQGKVELM